MTTPRQTQRTGWVTVDIPTHELRLVAAELHAMPRQAERAFDKALREGVRSLRPAIVRQLAHESGLPQRAVRKRVLTKFYYDGDLRVGEIFVGLNPVPAVSVISPSQLRRRHERRQPVIIQGKRVPRSFYVKPRSRSGSRNPYFALQRTGSRRYPVRWLEQKLYLENIGWLVKEENRVADLIERRFTFHLRGELGK